MLSIKFLPELRANWEVVDGVWQGMFGAQTRRCPVHAVKVWFAILCNR